MLIIVKNAVIFIRCHLCVYFFEQGELPGLQILGRFISVHCKPLWANADMTNELFCMSAANFDQPPA